MPRFLNMYFECISRTPCGNAFPRVQSASPLSENLYAERCGSVENTFQSAVVVAIFGNCQYTSNTQSTLNPVDEKKQKSKVFQNKQKNLQNTRSELNPHTTVFPLACKTE